MRWIRFILVLFFISSCRDNSSTENLIITQPSHTKTINDSSLVKNFSFEKGDLRRYALNPDQHINVKIFDEVIRLAEQGLEIKFQEGIYNIDLVLSGRQNLSFIFDNTVISGSVQIIDRNNKPSKNISLKGNLTVLDKVFIRTSSNVQFDTLTIATDTLKSLTKKHNRGFSIYAGSKDIRINNLTISHTGGSADEFYKFTAAALQVHGWNNNPENVVINKLIVENAARTAVYLTGNNHIIKKAIIKDYATTGSNKNMFGLEDAKPGSEKQFAGFWINKCHDCLIDSLEIHNNSAVPFSLKFGIGTYSKPAIINNLSLKGQAKNAQIEDDLLTNILVKNEY